MATMYEQSPNAGGTGASGATGGTGATGETGDSQTLPPFKTSLDLLTPI